MNVDIRGKAIGRRRFRVFDSKFSNAEVKMFLTFYELRFSTWEAQHQKSVQQTRQYLWFTNWLKSNELNRIGLQNRAGRASWWNIMMQSLFWWRTNFSNCLNRCDLEKLWRTSMARTRTGRHLHGSILISRLKLMSRKPFGFKNH